MVEPLGDRVLDDSGATVDEGGVVVEGESVVLGGIDMGEEEMDCELEVVIASST